MSSEWTAAGQGQYCKGQSYFHSPTTHLWKDWLGKLSFFLFFSLPITKQQQQKKPRTNFTTPDKK
jgi:hypothetical protein